jgi:heme/copper-type cytochrome/quinol oxidase subunit 2
MIDTVSINYGLSKLGALINQAAPALQNVSEQYVHFVVVKTVTILPIMLVAFVVSIFFLTKSLKGLESDPSDPFDDPVAIIGTIFSSVAVLVFMILFITSVYNVCLALSCPEMFTIHQIINAAQK